jgi:hypothetical protein
LHILSPELRNCRRRNGIAAGKGRRRWEELHILSPELLLVFLAGHSVLAARAPVTFFTAEDAEER